MNIELEKSHFKKEIKSYVLRSRMSVSQKISLQNFWGDYGVSVDKGRLDFGVIFGRQAPTVLEIGFGMGNSLLELAEQHPDLNFIGIEVHKPGIGAILLNIRKKQLSNLRIICKNAIEVLNNHILDNSLFGVLLFFPDPWPKRRHHKRRIVQPHFVDIIHQKLQRSGYFHLATDVTDYAKHMSKVIYNHQGFTKITKNEKFIGSLERPKTKFAERGKDLGHEINDLLFIKKGFLGEHL
jgi:tRNA (guanine-N7-)-methyltransferase